MNNNSNSGGVGLLTVLTIVFVTLKLVGVIDWSWWWVLAPVWAPTLAVLVLFAVFLTAGTVAGVGREDER
ncbi:hypothetical protein G6024_01115 [Dietzia maris]|nr:hypothetical protein [Dietzia maris]MBB0995722.1 hypothetical protein [Dietzia maris]